MDKRGRSFIALRPVSRISGGQFAILSDTVVYVNMDHVLRVTMHGGLAFVVMRDGRIIRAYKADFMKQVEKLHAEP